MSDEAMGPAKTDPGGDRLPRVRAGMAARIAEREAGDSMLRFLSRLAAFGLAASPDPLLRPVKPAG